MTFAISVLIWAFIPLLNSSNYFINLWLAVLGLYGPSIAGIIASYRFQGTYWQLYISRMKFFFPLIVISLSLGLAYMYHLTRVISAYSNNLTPIVILLICLSSFLSSYFISLMIRPPPGFETRNDQPFQIKSQTGMLLFSLIFPLIIGLISFTLQWLLFSYTIVQTPLEYLEAIFFGAPLYFISFAILFGGAANEEIGWRGYLTPKALQGMSPLKAGLMIGVLWTVWHIPLYIIGFYDGGLIEILIRFLWNVPMGVVFTWYYVKSGYNLLGAILLHATFNIFSDIGAFLLIPAYTITAIVMVFESKMWITNYGKRKQLMINLNF